MRKVVQPEGILGVRLMIRKLASLIGLTLALMCHSTAEHAQADESNDAIERSKKTALIYFRHGAKPEQKEQIINDADLQADPAFVQEFNEEKDTWLAAHDKGGSFVANISPEKARQYLTEKKYTDLAFVVRNTVVSLFSTACDDTTATPLPTMGNTPNQNITKMGGPLQGNTSRRTWILDSGVFTASNRLNIDTANAAGCTQGGSRCKTAVGHMDRIEDTIGHGTFIAGIIAGKDIGQGSILGMLPGAQIVPVQVFNGNNRDTNLDAIQRAVDWVLTDAPSPAADGDVVNISWGMHVAYDDLIEDGSSAYSPYESVLHQLADRGVKISVAAGNFDNPGKFADTGGYVELLSPARLGGYTPQANGGAIVTVSGIDNTGNFWFTSPPPSGSFFGNGGRPKFAAPSVDIQSLWITNKQNVCTGTSWAAAHISGALLQSNDVVLADYGESANDVDNENDHVATCNKTNGVCIIN
jgi:hypothetical protein